MYTINQQACEHKSQRHVLLPYSYVLYNNVIYISSTVILLFCLK